MHRHILCALVVLSLMACSAPEVKSQPTISSSPSPEQSNTTESFGSSRVTLDRLLHQALQMRLDVREIDSNEGRVIYDLYGRIPEINGIEKTGDLWISVEDSEHGIWPQRSGAIFKDCIIQGTDFHCVLIVGFVSSYPLFVYIVRVNPETSPYLRTELRAYRAVRLVSGDPRLLGRFKQVCGPFPLEAKKIECVAE